MKSISEFKYMLEHSINEISDSKEWSQYELNEKEMLETLLMDLKEAEIIQQDLSADNLAERFDKLREIINENKKGDLTEGKFLLRKLVGVFLGLSFSTLFIMFGFMVRGYLAELNLFHNWFSFLEKINIFIKLPLELLSFTVIMGCFFGYAGLTVHISGKIYSAFYRKTQAKYESEEYTLLNLFKKRSLGLSGFYIFFISMFLAGFVYQSLTSK